MFLFGFPAMLPPGSLFLKGIYALILHPIEEVDEDWMVQVQGTRKIERAGVVEPALSSEGRNMRMGRVTARPLQQCLAGVNWTGKGSLLFAARRLLERSLPGILDQLLARFRLDGEKILIDLEYFFQPVIHRLARLLYFVRHFLITPNKYSGELTFVA
jgi:hypothetical protein